MLQQMLYLVGVGVIVLIIGVINALMKWTDKNNHGDKWKDQY